MRNLILREVLALIAAGILIGSPAAFVLIRYVESMLYGVKSYDPLAIGGALSVVVPVAFAAGYFPARRATRIDPFTAVRYE